MVNYGKVTMEVEGGWLITTFHDWTRQNNLRCEPVQVGSPASQPWGSIQGWFDRRYEAGKFRPIIHVGGAK